MAIANADGSIVLTMKADDSGLKQSTRNLKSEAAKLAAEYRKAGMSQSEAFKKAWSEIERTKKETIKTTKATKEYGEQVQKSAGTAKTAFSKVGGALNKLAIAAAAAFAVNKIIQFSAQSAEIATTAEASIQRLIDIYGSASKSVGDFIDANAQALGMSRAAAASFSSVYGNLFSVWADQATNAELTNRYLNMTAVVASKTGRTVEDVQERIRSGLLGNTEAIEDLGIFVNVKTIEMTDAFQRMASGKSWEQLDAYTQQQIRTMAILEQATAKYGNEVARTSALTKSQFSAAWQDFQATWGQVVNQILIPVLQVLTDILVESTAVMRMMFGISSATISQGNATDELIEKQDDLTKSIKETEKAAKKAVAPFDELAILSGGSSQQEETVTSIVLPEVDLTTSKNEVSAFAESLSASYSKISEAVKKAWDSQPVQAFYEAAKTYGGFLWDYWSTLGTNLWKNLKITWGNIQGDFSTMTSNMSGLWTTFWQDIKVGIDTWRQPIIDGVSGVFNSIWTTAIDPYIQLMVGAWSDFTGILKSKWEEYGKPLVDNIGQFSRNVIAYFQSIYDDVLEPIITPFLETMSWLWENHLSKMIESASDLVLKTTNAALEIYNKFIHPIVMWLRDLFAPAWSFIASRTIGELGTVIAAITDVRNGILKRLGGIIDFISGIFTRNWRQAWDGVKSIFKGSFDALVGIAKAPLNLVIDAINALIAGLNKVSFSIPDWEVFGDWAGRSFGINIPKIPKLAQGAVIPPNREFLAVLGDNKRENEIVSPVSAMKQAFTEAMIEMGGYNGGGNTEVVLEIDGREFGRAVVEQGNRENRRIGTRLVIV